MPFKSRNSKEIIKGLLQHDLSRRLGNLAGGARDVMQDPWFAGFDWVAMQSQKLPAPHIPHIKVTLQILYFQIYSCAG